MTRVFAAGAIAFLVASAAQAQPLNFDQAAYVTCREAHNMQVEPRKALALYLAEHAARHRGVIVPDGDHGTHLALLVRGGCTLSPDAYLFTVIDRALVAEIARLPKRR